MTQLGALSLTIKKITSPPKQKLKIISKYLLRDSSNEKSAVIHTHADAEGSPLSYLVIIELLHALLSLSSGGENDKCIASVQIAEMIHHQSNFIDHPDLLKYWY